jgi:hypothetical protein
MTTIITRLFASHDAGKAAIEALYAKGLRRDGGADIVGPMDDRNAAVSAIAKTGVPMKAASAYAPHLTGSTVLVVVRAPFGTSLEVKDTLDGHHPVASGLKTEEFYLGSVDRRSMAPNRHLPTLLNSDTLVMSGRLLPTLVRSSTPFSSLFGMPTISRSSKTSGSLVTGSTTPFSSALGLPMLSKGRRS